MKFYPALNYSYGTHTVKYTLQYNEHIGSFAIKTKGNCKGYSLLDSPFDWFDMDDFARTEKDNLDFDYDEDFQELIIIFSPGTSNQTAITVDPHEAENLIVKIEIVDFDGKEE